MVKRNNKATTESAPVSTLARRSPRRLRVLLSSVSVVCLQVFPAYGDVVAVAGSGTSLSVAGAVTDVTTSNLRDSIGFNRFSEFNVDAGRTVNLYQPENASALVNIIENSAGASTIDGVLNAKVGNPLVSVLGGNTYLVNSAGFVVSASGVINAGNLTLSTPTTDFVNSLISQSEGGSGGLGALPSTALFAGQEPLSANGEIDIQGHINAARLDMRAGARMIVDGRLDVQGITSRGPLNPSVNIDGVPTAGGVNIGRNGVIRLVSGGSARVRGDVSARVNTATPNPYGGLIEIIAEGELRAGGMFNVSNGAGPAGSVMMFTTGSAILEPALEITARSTAAAGGFVAIRAGGSITVDQTGEHRLVLDTSGNGGEAFLVADTIELSRDLFTYGGSLGISAASKVDIGRDGGTLTLSSERVGGAAGDIVVSAPQINVTPDTTINARGTGADNGGLVALVARNVTTGIVWAINPDARNAKITIEDSTIAGGSVVVTATAKATNTFGDPDELVEATQVDEMEGATTEEEFNQLFDDTLDTFELIAARGITSVNDLIPLQIQILAADARVEITNSTLTADGNWIAATPSQTDTATEFATNGYLSAAGLREDSYQFLAPASIIESTFFDDAYQININLPSGIDLASDSLIVHSHAATEVDIAPRVFGLGLAVTHMQTESSVKILDSDLVTNAGNIRLAATASENQTINIRAKKLPGVAGAVGVVVSVRDLRNQLLVDGGTLDSAGGITAGAFAGRNLSSTVIANSGMEGQVAIGVNLDFSESLSEAAIGGIITARAGDITIGAEQLMFNLSRTNSATMGLGNFEKAATRHRTSSSGATGFAQTLQQTATGKTPDPDRKPHFGMGVAVDIQINDDNAFATLGGSYSNIDDLSEAPTALGATVATATGNTVTVNAAYRFADRGNEGGGVLTRSTSAAFGKLTLALKRELDRFNALNPTNPITEDELLGRFSNALMLNVSVASMIGEARAEIGSNATVNAASLDLNAVTRFPNTSPVEALDNQWDNYVDQVTSYQPLTDTGAATPPEPTPPPAPDLVGFLDIGNPLTYLTTDSKAKGEASVANNRTVVPGEEQALALGVTLTYFNTDNQTQAVIRDGAVVNLQDTASVSAVQESLFLHATNLPKTNPLGGSAKVDDAIGGGIHFGRTVSSVLAEIESGATVSVASGDLDVTAYTRNIVVSLAYSGGQGSDVAINASIAAQVSEAQTIARIGEAARITAQDVTIAATDASVTWNTAGAISGSDVVGVGASGVFNFTSREVRAGIAPRDRAAPLAAATGDVVTADSLTILAQNNAVDVTVAVAGTKVVGKPDPAPETDPPANTEDDDMIIPSWLFSDEEEDAANAQQNVDTPADSQGQQQQSGWAVSGAAAVNLALQNETIAEIRTRDRIVLDTDAVGLGGLTITARSAATIVNVTGAVSAGLGSDKDTNALAGAFSVHVDERNLRSQIDGAVISAGHVTILADDQATLANVAVGGAGTSRGDIALAGSVSFAILSGETLAEIRDTDLTSDSVDMRAEDRSTTVSIGGAVGINMDATQGYGVGVGIAVNTVLRDATARITGTGAITTGLLSVAALSQQSIYGFAISAGVGKTGLAGSVTVNTIVAGARSLVDGTGSGLRRIKADALTLTADETNTIFALAGALAGGRSTAVGASVAVNTIVAGTEARLEDTILTGRDAGPALGQVSVTADSDSTITAISVAGAAAISEQAAGIGLSVNTITANAIASLARSQIADAGALLATANGARVIRSLAGGVAAAGRGAAGAGLTLNLLPSNVTKVILDDATLTTRDAGAVTATATAAGEIASAAVGISASTETAIGGALTVNVTTAETAVSATNADIVAGGALSLTATDTATISSLSGGAAISLGGNGVGGAASANFIAHDTSVLANNGSLTGAGITLSANNTSDIESLAVGLAAASSNAFAGSIAIGDIGNSTRAQAAGTTLNGGTGAVSVTAARGGNIDILSGSAAVGGSNAVGAALSVAIIHGGATADIITNDGIAGSSLDVQSTDTASIDAIAVSGAAGIGNSGFAGSVVYTQVGRVTEDGPSVDPLPGGAADEDPLNQAQASIRAARDGAIADLTSNLTGRAGVTLDADDVALSLVSDDIIRARLELTGTAPTLPGLSLTTTQTGTTRSLAGAAGFGSNAGVGAGFALNLMFGKAEAELILPATEDVTTTGPVAISTTQTGTVDTAGVAGGGAGAVGGAGSITVNVMNRQASARMASNVAASQASLLTQGNDLDMNVVQSGTINSIAGAAGIGGSSGFGGAIAVSVVSDDAAAILLDVIVDTRNGTALNTAGSVTIDAQQTIDMAAAAAAVGGSGGGSFAGSFAVNVADGNVGTTLGSSAIFANTVTATASATPSLTGNAGAVAVGSTAAVGVAIVTNVGRQIVRTDIDGSQMRAAGAVILGAGVDGALSGNAISGAASLAAGVAGTGVGNSALNTAELLIRDSRTPALDAPVGGSDIVTTGSVLMTARAVNAITLRGGSEEEPGVQVNFAGGGAAGVGASATVNTLGNTAKVAISGNSRVVGLGQSSVLDDGVARFGVAADAATSASISMLTANGAVGGVAGVAALFSINLINDDARVVLGEAGSNALVRINGDVSELASDLGSTAADARQDARLTAQSSATATVVTANIAVGGKAGVGAGSGNLVTRAVAAVDVTGAEIIASRDIILSAETVTDLTAVTFGLSGGFVGVAANAGVSVLAAQALVDVNASDLTAGRNLTLETLVDSDSVAVTGAAAGGAVGGAGGVQVTVFESTSRVSVGRNDAAGDSNLTAQGDISLTADSELTLDGKAVSGAFGGVGIALAVNVGIVKATTLVEIGTSETLIAQQSLSLRAKDTVDITGLSGSLGAGGLGLGASFDYTSFRGTTQVQVGNNNLLAADLDTVRLADPSGSARNITIEALSERRITTAVVAIGAGNIAINAALGIVDMGARATDPDGNRDALLADAQSELGADLKGDSGDLDADEQRSTAGSLMGYAGADATRGTVAGERQAISLNGAVTTDSVAVVLGNAVTLNTRGNVTLRADVATSVTQTAGGLSASAFGGGTSGVAVTNIATSAGVQIGSNSVIRADGNVTLSALNGALDAGSLLAVKSFTLAASAGYSVGVGVAIAAVNATSAVDLGSGVSIGGYLGQRAGTVDLSAERAGTTATDVVNASVSVAGGAGLVVSDATIAGGTAIRVGGENISTVSRIAANRVVLATDDTSRATADGEGSSGGIGAGLNSVIVSANADATGELKAYALEITAEDVRLANQSAVSAQADARGLAVGAVAIGASIATAQMRANLDTVVQATISAADIALETQFRSEGFANAAAFAQSTSGGLLAGNGAVASAWGNYTVSADYGGVYAARNATTIITSAAGVRLQADTTGAQGGVFAIGKTIAQAGQNQSAALSDSEKLAAVDLVVNNAMFSGKALIIDTSNTPNVSVDATAGSGGLVSGSASEALMTVSTRTTADIGSAGTVMVDGMESVSITTGQVATMASKVDTISAAALGVSGALTDSDITSTVATTLGSNLMITADTIEIAARNTMSRPEDGFNVTSGSGGVFDGAAISSKITVNATTDVTIADGAMVLQTGLADNGQEFNVGASTTMSLVDRVNLDAGGAIAAPRGQSEIDIASNNATVTIGDAKLFAVDQMRIYSGGDANIRAEVNANSYGLAGAATGSSKVDYNANNSVVLSDGAELESLRDVRIAAGYDALGAQNVTLKAETRLFNKTAIPIPSDPAADVVANTLSRIDVQEGARVLAVRDVYLFAEEGERALEGYGRGKDLYREALAELGSAISEAFGGEPVSLDIESGSATNTSDNGIIVNGYVRAGSRNKQILVLDVDNTLNNARANNGDQVYTDEMVAGITYNIRENVSIASDVLERVALLDRLLADPTLNSDAAAVAAWEAERSVLLLRDTAGTADFVDLEDIVASEGNIILRADYVHGTDTGTLDAPGNAEIIVQVYSDAFINTKAMDIPENAGGRITFNDVVVTTPQDIVDLSDPTRPGITQYEMISGADAGLPKIEVVTFGQGSIIVGGAISNPDGLAFFNSNQGDLDVRADISARTIDLRAGRDFLQGFTVGIRNVDGNPESIYRDYFVRVQDLLRDQTSFLKGLSFDAGEDVTFTVNFPSLGDLPFNTGTIPDFVAAPKRGRIQGGRNVYISADKLNINGLIQAGRGSFNLEIDSAIDTYLDTLAGTSGIVTLYDPSEPFTTDSATGISNLIRNENINSDVFVRFDPTATNDRGEVTGAILVSPMVVQGGVVEITGQIFSTGGGEIRSLDGFGTINVESGSRRPIQLGRLDTGSDTVAGVEGVVRITDTTYLTDTTPALITEYRRIGSVLEVRNSATFNEIEIDFDSDGIVDLVRIEPTNLVSSSGASGGRLGVYAPKERQELVINRAETVTRVSTNTQTTRYFFFEIGKDQKIETRAPVVTELEPSVVTGLSGTYLSTATSDLTAPYRVTARQVSSTPVRSTNTVNDKRILGVGDVVTTWTVTRTSTELYSHRLKADYGVLINFDGTDSGGLNVVSTGDIMLSGPVRNAFGTTNLSSEAGSLLTADVSVVVNVGDTSLAGLGGRIDGNGSEFRLEQTAGSTLSAIARDSINLREMNGDMRISSVVTTGRGGAVTNSLVGQVRLTADGGIIGVGDGPHVVGSSLDLTAITGGIGAIGAPLIITEDGGALTALANGDINLRESTGDLNLRDVQSQTGDVTLAVPLGSILDRNDIETRDSRNDAELAELWSNDLGLFGDAQVAAREAAQIAALKAERERSYNDYWNAREAAGGAPLTFVLDATTAQALRDGGWTDAQIAAYVAEREALFAQWNAHAARDSDYAYTVTLEERAAVLDGATWSAQQLQEWIRAGLIRGTGDTNARIEDPNIRAAGDMTIITRDNVGELLPDFILGADRAENLRVLSAAERADITIDNATNTVSVARRENLNIAFTATDAEGRPLGSLDVPLVGGDIFIGSESAVDIRQLAATGDVFLQIDGAVTDGSPAGVAAVSGLNLVLESGNAAPMGTLANPLSLDIRDGGSLIARSGTGLYLETIGDAPLAELFSGGALVLDAAGQITDAVATGAVRVRAGDISLAATAIGTEATPLVIELTGTDGAADLVTRTGDAFVAAQGALRLRAADLFGGGVLSTTQGLALVGNDTLRFGTPSTLQLIAPQGIDLATSTGRDIAGGALTIRSGGAVGTGAKPLTTAVASLDFTATGSDATPLFVDEADDLVVETITQTAAGSETEIVATGVLSVGVITSAAEVRLDAGAIATGRIIATRTQLVAGMGLGTTTRLDITTGALQALSTTGDIRIGLRDRDVDIEEMQTGGTGSIDLISTDAVVTLLDGNGISTTGGAITGQLTQLVAGADITSSGGDIALTTEQTFNLLDNRTIDSGAGQMTLRAQNALMTLGTGAILQSGAPMTVNAGSLTMGADGLIDSGTGDMTVTSSGGLSLGERVHLRSAMAAMRVSGDSITLADSVVMDSAGGTFALSSANALTMAAGVVLQSGATMTVSAGSLSMGVDGLIDSGTGDMTVTSAGGLSLGERVQLRSAMAAMRVSGDSITLADSVVMDSAGGTFALSSANALTMAAGVVLQSGATMTVSAGSLSMGVDGLIDSGTGDMTVTSAGGLSLGERVQLRSAMAAMRVSGDSITLADSVVMDSAGGTFALSSAKALTMAAGVVLQSGATMTVSAGSLSMGVDGLIDSGPGDMTVTSAGGLSLGERVQLRSAMAAMRVSGDSITLANSVAMDSAGGTIDLSSTNALTMAWDVRVLSGGGNVTAQADQMTQGAGGLIDSSGGMLAVTAAGDLIQTASAEMTSQTGTLSVSVGGDMQIARIATTNATDDALALDVAGNLTVAAGQRPVQIEANSSGALSVLRIGRLVPQGPEGLRVAIDTLDLETRLGDIHINESDGIVLQNVVARNGLIDIFSAGRTQIQTIRAETAAPIVLTTSSGDMLADNAFIAGGDTRIFALNGALAGITSDTFRADTADGTTLHLFASTDLRYAETAGDLRVGFALADQGDLTLEALDGSQRIGILGATGALTMRARDSLRVTMIGESSVDLADAEALSLVNPSVYGLREAKSPRDVDLLTQTAGGEIIVGLIGVQTSLDLVGDRIDLLTHDVDPARGLLMTVMDAAGGLADRVDIASVGAGAKLFVADGDYFTDPRPRLLDRGRTSGATGTLTLTQGYIGTGDISHAGPAFIGDDIRIGGDVWFRQGNFDLLATTQYKTLSKVADAQALAFFGGEMTFEIRDNIVLDTIAQGQPIDGSGGTVLVLNRRLGGIDLNGGQGFAFGTGVDTDILGFPTAFQDGDQGVTMPLVIQSIMDQYDMGTTLLLNRFVTQEDCESDDSCPDLSEVR